MLSASYRDQLEQFLKALIPFKESLELAQPNLLKVQKQYDQLQQLYPPDLSWEDPDQAASSAIASRQQAIHTEIHRALRLLQTELLFLQASRQKATIEQKLYLARLRVDQLLGFCQKLQQE